MFNYSLQHIVLAAGLLLATPAVTAQKVQEPKPMNADWAKPYPPFRIAGNLYYVGTYDLACYLITTPAGNILINTGLAASATQIKNNIKALGFQFADIKILLTTQAHYDHMGAMADVKKATGAQLLADEKETGVLEDGGSSDYALGGKGSSFKPVKPDRLLHDGDTITLGNMQLVMLHHPGHTKGSCSFLFTVQDAQQSYRVLIANLPTIVTEKSFEAITTYPEITADYAYTLKAMQQVPFDIWLASHASQFNLHTKHKPGDAYNPAAFKDPQGYATAISDLQKEYEEKLQGQPAKSKNATGYPNNLQWYHRLLYFYPETPILTPALISVYQTIIFHFKKAIMKAFKFFTTLFFLLGTFHFTHAQTAVNDVVKEWERAKAYTKEYLDTMPEPGYALKPTKEMRSFAEQMLHLTDANYGFVSAITGEKSPVGFGDSEKVTDKSKANVTKLVMDGYDFVINSIKKMTPAQLNENVKLFGRFDLTKGAALAKCFEHQTHHRGQTTVYIRLAGATPPQEKLF